MNYISIKEGREDSHTYTCSVSFAGEMTGESTTEKIREERRGGVGHIPFSNKFPKTIVCIHFKWELGIFSSSCLKWRERETFEST